MRIRELPVGVANQIAAGEVIERPASVVKELLENAADAGAKSIQIFIDYGGLNRIKISDDGQGILPEDLPLAVAAHATSKISCLDDLYSITSMGFRGEALASIASVSRLSITSRAIGQTQAYVMNLVSEGQAVAPTARIQGTTIDVQDLFYNAPVRKKFLKTAKTEFHAIEMLVKRFALSMPGIAISLQHNGKDVLSLPAAKCDKSRVARIKKIFGKTFIEQSTAIKVSRSGMKLNGWIGYPDYHRSQNDKQYIYINGRMIRDKLLTHAIKQSYDDLLPPGRHPGCLLYLEVPAHEVDVNVHPTKHEVRFQEPRLVHDFIVMHLTEALGSSKSRDVEYALPSYTKKPLQIREGAVEQLAIKPVTASSVDYEIVPLQSPYALFSYENTLFLINTQKLYEVGTLYRLQQKLLPFEKRPLLVPVSFECQGDAEQLIEKYQTFLMEFGIEVDLFAHDKILIRSIPRDVPQLDIQAFMRRLHHLKLPDKDSILKLLAAHSCMISHPLGGEEEQEMIALFHLLLSENECERGWCRQLDAATCKEILHD